MSVSFDKASTLQAATSHQCSRDADCDGEGGRNGYPSDSVEAALIRDKLHVVSSENHDQVDEEASGSEETPCSSSGSDGEGVGTTVLISATVWEISLQFWRQTFYQTEFAESVNKWL